VLYSLNRWMGVLLALCWLSGTSHAEPMQLSVQGRLTSASGGPVADGNYAMAIGLYAQAAGGSPLFEENFLAISVQGGVFAEQLGAAKIPLDTSLFASGQALWVAVTVGKDELPRLPVSRVAYAAQASHAAVAKVAESLQCSGCVNADQLAKGAVTTDKIAAGAVGAAQVSINWANADSPGGAAIFALAANTAKQADSAGYADEAAKALTATNATNAVNAATAATAKGLQCTGCVGLGALAAEVSTAFVASQDGSAKGKLSVEGELALGSSVISGGRFAVVDTSKAVCDATIAGQIVLASGNGKLYYCDGKAWARFATCSGQCPAAELVVCGAPLLDSCGDPCGGSGTFCSAEQVCTAGKCIGVLGSKDNPAVTCKDLLAKVPGTVSGLRWIDPDGNGVLPAFQVFCDMTTQGGGWTRVDESTDYAFKIYSEGVAEQPYSYLLSDAQIDAIKAKSTEGRQAWACRTVGVGSAYDLRWWPKQQVDTYGGCWDPGNSAEKTNSGTETSFANLPQRSWFSEDCGDPSESCQHNVDHAWFR
jgi:hypothetical protein